MTNVKRHKTETEITRIPVQGYGWYHQTRGLREYDEHLAMVKSGHDKSCEWVLVLRGMMHEGGSPKEVLYTDMGKMQVSVGKKEIKLSYVYEIETT